MQTPVSPEKKKEREITAQAPPHYLPAFPSQLIYIPAEKPLIPYIK
jgi:hypothetical protein